MRVRFIFFNLQAELDHCQIFIKHLKLPKNTAPDELVHDNIFPILYSTREDPPAFILR